MVKIEILTDAQAPMWSANQPLTISLEMDSAVYDIFCSIGKEKEKDASDSKAFRLGFLKVADDLLCAKCPDTSKQDIVEETDKEYKPRRKNKVKVAGRPEADNHDIKRYMKLKDVSQTDLAGEIDVSPSSVTRLLKYKLEQREAESIYAAIDSCAEKKGVPWGGSKVD